MTRSRRWRWLALITIVTIVLACSSAPTPAPTAAVAVLTPAPAASEAAPAPTEGAVEETAWQQVLAQIGPEGEVSSDTALQAFALAFGPLPGVTVPSGPVGEIRSGSGALRWLVGHWDEITPEQRAEAVRLVPELGGDHQAPPAAQQQPEGGGPLASAVATVRPPSFYTDLALSLAGEIQAKTGYALELRLNAAEGRTQQALARADTGVYNALGGTYGTADHCIITISPRGARDEGAELEDTLAHEVWHCMQGQARNLAWFYSAPSWIIEGQAEWVGDALRPNAKALGWADYVLFPERKLFARSYDAIGFYAHLTRSQIDTWDVLLNMLLADDDNVARFEASGATTDLFLDTWASSHFREPAPLGAAWDVEGPGLPAGRGAVRVVLTVANDKSVPFSAPAYTNKVHSLSVSADIIVFTVEGHVRLGDPEFNQEYVLAGAAFCTKPGGCTCPPGTEFAGAPPNRLSTETYLAITGGQDGAQGTVIGHRLEEFCLAGKTWSLVLWSPDMGDAAPPLMVAYTCDGLVSTWKAIYLPSLAGLTETFELPFGNNLVAHIDIHRDVPPAEQSAAFTLDYALDFTLVPSAEPPVIIVTGTKTETQGGQVWVFPPREFGSDAPMEVKNVSLETQLTPYPDYQHPFRAQALTECGG